MQRTEKKFKSTITSQTKKTNIANNIGLILNQKSTISY
jgi:hypothetical protein